MPFAALQLVNGWETDGSECVSKKEQCSSLKWLKHCGTVSRALMVAMASLAGYYMASSDRRRVVRADDRTENRHNRLLLVVLLLGHLLLVWTPLKWQHSTEPASKAEHSRQDGFAPNNAWLGPWAA